MAHYLRKFERKYGTYLVIYESHLDKNKGRVVNNHVKVIGYVDDLKKQGIDNPIEYARKEIELLNKKRDEQIIADSMKKVEAFPIKNYGYFIADVLMNKLNVDRDIDLLNYSEKLPINLSGLLRDLIYSRLIKPASKKHTFEEVIPTLINKNYEGNLDNIYKGLDFLGHNYSRVIEIFNYHISQLFKRQTDTVYFDCTNFFFEIDKEDELRRKGPSKENRMSPIVSVGLLLDKDQIPIAMKIFPGNESEKPVIRNIIKDMKKSCNITGRTIQVADKGLNCSQNIIKAVENGDGYIYSQSVKKLEETELMWLLNKNDYNTIVDPSTKKITHKYKSCVDTYKYNYKDEKGNNRCIQLKQKRLITWNSALYEKQRAEIIKMVDKANSFACSQAKKNELGEMSKYVKFDADSKIFVGLNNEKIEKDLALAGYNMIITSEINMGDQEIHETYQQLWRIEESFRIMKSELDARPVYLQKTHRICGHFLICYLCVTLLRLLQFKYFKQFNSQQLLRLMKNMQCFYEDNRYVNLTKLSEDLESLSEAINLPLTNYYLTHADFQKLFKKAKYGKK